MKDFGNEKNKGRNLLSFSSYHISLLPRHTVLCFLPGKPTIDWDMGLSLANGGLASKTSQRVSILSTAVDGKDSVDTEALGNSGTAGWEGACVPARNTIF